MQRGELKQINGSWMVRYYDAGKRHMKKLARVSDYPTENDISPTYLNFMAEVNKPSFRPEAGTLLRTFVNESYFPGVTSLRGSTLRGYKAIWSNHIEPRMGSLRVREIHTFDCQQCMDSIIRENPTLKMATLSRVKSFLHTIFAEAIRLGLHGGSAEDNKNFVTGIKIRCSKECKRKGVTGAYLVEDVKGILAALSEPTKVLMAIAAYSGLRRGEIVGLKWEDYDGERLWVRRNICFGEHGEMSVEEPKTEASGAPVPVIAPLRSILNAWKGKAMSGLADRAESTLINDCWIFQAGFTRKKNHPAALLDACNLTPLSPANVLRDVILPALEKAEIPWLGYHAFRRGLATNLRALSVDDLTICEILRHSDVAVTRASYIKRVSEKSIEGMGRLEAELAKPPKGVQRGQDVVLAASIA